MMRNIEKTFRIRNYYTVIDGEERSDIVEREFYGKIDNYLGEVLPEIMDSIDRGQTPSFSGEPLRSLREVVVAMAKRTPEFVKKYDEVVIGREVVEATLAELPNDPDNEERVKMLTALRDPNRLREIGRSVRVRATIDRSDRIEDALEAFSVRWAVSETHHSYILSSLMAYRIGNGGSNGLDNPNMEIWMPVAPKVALVLLRDPRRDIPLKVVGSPRHIRKVNEFAKSTSQQIASHSKVLLESLKGKRARLV